MAKKLTKAEMAAHNPRPQMVVPVVDANGELVDREISLVSLDRDRAWVNVTCGNGHVLLVEAHEGGSRAHCDQCGEFVDYGGYRHTPEQDALRAAQLAEARALLEEAGELPPAPDRAIVAGDAAVSGDASS